MGRPKALLPVPPNQTPLLVYVMERLRALVSGDVVVVANEPEVIRQSQVDERVLIVADRYPNAGTLGGIATGLGRVSAWAMVVACDMPLLKPALFRYFQHLTGEQEDAGGERWDVIMPIVNGYEEPLHALYHRRCLPAIEARLQRGQRRVISFLPDVRVRYVSEDEMRPFDPQLQSFVNVNTPEDWLLVLDLLKESAD